MRSLIWVGRRGVYRGFAPQQVQPLVRFTAAFLLLNLPFWLLGQWIFISRPWFNVELVLPLLLATVSQPLAVATLVFEWFLDLGVSQSFTYHFSSPFEFVRSLSFLDSVRVFEFVSISNVALAVPFALCAVGGFKLIPPRSAACTIAMSLAIVLATVDIANGSSMFWQRPTRFVSANVTGSPALTLFVKSWNERRPAALRPLPARSAVDVAGLSAWAAQHPDGSMLLLVVESMGLSRSDGVNGWLRSQLFDASLSKRFDLSEMPIAFAGSTTSAELRELCGLGGSYRRLLGNTRADCLPARLSRQGWTTFGVHGFSGHMFDRIKWWPQVGLDSQLFAEDILKPGNRTCGGAFAGACDTEVIALALRRASAPRRFVYALTLNSHLPLAPLPVPEELATLCARDGLSVDVCLLTATIGKALAALRDGLKASTTSKMAVVVVGDHAPPLSNLRDRATYDAEHVAAFVLKPRQ